MYRVNPDITKPHSPQENAEAQLRSFRQCRDHPDMYNGQPRTQKLTGGGFAADDGVGPGAQRCVEIQQMRGRCQVSLYIYICIYVYIDG